MLLQTTFGKGVIRKSLASFSDVTSSGDGLLPIAMAATSLSDLVSHVRRERQHKLKERIIAKLETSGEYQAGMSNSSLCMRKGIQAVMSLTEWGRQAQQGRCLTKSNESGPDGVSLLLVTDSKLFCTEVLHNFTL